MTLPLFLLNLVLAGVWIILNQNASFFHLIMGFLAGAVITHIVAIALSQGNYLGKLWTRFRFVGYFIRILIEANIEVAKEILTPGHSMKPCFIRYDVSDLDPVQTTTLASAITLTPGTLSTDVSDDGNTLYIHAMYAENRDEALAALDELRRRLMEDVFAS